MSSLSSPSQQKAPNRAGHCQRDTKPRDPWCAAKDHPEPSAAIRDRARWQGQAVFWCPPTRGPWHCPGVTEKDSQAHAALCNFYGGAGYFCPAKLMKAGGRGTEQLKLEYESHVLGARRWCHSSTAGPTSEVLGLSPGPPMCWACMGVPLTWAGCHRGGSVHEDPTEVSLFHSHKRTEVKKIKIKMIMTKAVCLA